MGIEEIPSVIMLMDARHKMKLVPWTAQSPFNHSGIPMGRQEDDDAWRAERIATDTERSSTSSSSICAFVDGREQFSTEFICY